MEKFLLVTSWGLLIWAGIQIILSIMLVIVNAFMPEEKKMTCGEIGKKYNVSIEIIVFIIALATIFSV